MPRGVSSLAVAAGAWALAAAPTARADREPPEVPASEDPAPAAPEATAPVAPAPNDLGVEAVGTIPIGGWRDVAGIGLGGGVRVRVPLASDLTITARVFGVFHLPVDMTAPVAAETTVMEFPLLGGARYHVSDPGTVRGYVFGEVGVVFRRTDVEVAGIHERDTDIVFASALGAGLELGRFDVHVAAWLADLGALDDAIGVTAGVSGTVLDL